jgi:hypothetical protein
VLLLALLLEAHYFDEMKANGLDHIEGKVNDIDHVDNGGVEHNRISCACFCFYGPVIAASSNQNQRIYYLYIWSCNGADVVGMGARRRRCVVGESATVTVTVGAVSVSQSTVALKDPIFNLEYG